MIGFAPSLLLANSQKARIVRSYQHYNATILAHRDVDTIMFVGEGGQIKPICPLPIEN